MSGKKILFISYDGMTDALGQSQVLPYLKDLTSKGHSISILSFEKPDVFQKRKANIHNFCKQNQIVWHPKKYRKSPPVLSTILDIREMQKAAERLHRQEQFDWIHCRSYIPGIIGLKLKRKYGIQMLFDMRGFWADERIDGEIWNLKNPLFQRIYHYFKKKEKQLFNESDHIVSLTEAGKAVLLDGRFGNIHPGRISVIPCCVDTQRFDPIKTEYTDKDAIRSSLRIELGAPVLGYVGSLGTWYLLNEMLDFFKVQLSKIPDAIFLFITAESEDMIRAKVEERDIPQKAVMVKQVDYPEVPKYVQIFNRSIFFIKPCFSKMASSPIKQGELMAMGIPVICNDGIGDSSEIVRKYEAGEVIENFNDETYDQINLLEGTYDAFAIRQGALEVFSLEGGIAAYAKIFEE